MKVFAVKLAAMDLPPRGSAMADIRISSTLMMREKRLILSKRSARLW